ncbi:tRNA (cytidine(34)-2'-O)-methyltransferase [Thiothrix litoralis]|uniref:tRNA (cytidine(34)-2'-O)-methyltransferase n=2 Tax=Thiothrix TaxID=1030 RepID=A0ABY9MK90_9GAMM|nr:MULTISPECIES: tRNA (cytidine(34)-2'-O)-methyltransferase [Thiothrix]QTR45541.1 tRNA (cytidine(34)-2'-O)-methyltransferase [Thiothrix litoralis]WML89094.1 tRNA (cytidine(34)-2'-O)-methyltransferase [Thiothrix lacustris]WMP15746.1 tRNA (cytidine(34)-2'-O)-methyltransferase [Thiothrix lacustris]
MFDIALYQPEIPPNTGNIMRLCANTGCRLHLIHPLGFSLDEKQVRRAGMDYRDLAVVQEHESFAAFNLAIQGKRVFALSTKASTHYSDAVFEAGDVLLFGPETRGLPEALLLSLPEELKLRVPMLPDSRSLNLSNTVAVVVYEALRQQQFPSLG